MPSLLCSGSPAPFPVPPARGRGSCSPRLCPIAPHQGRGLALTWPQLSCCFPAVFCRHSAPAGCFQPSEGRTRSSLLFSLFFHSCARSFPQAPPCVAQGVSKISSGNSVEKSLFPCYLRVIYSPSLHTFYFSKLKPNPSEILFYIYRQATPSRQGLPAPGEGAGSGCRAVAAVTTAAHRASTRAFGDCRSPGDSREQNICPSRPCYGASHPIQTRGCSHRMHKRLGAAVISLGATTGLYTALFPPLAAKIVCCRELGGAARQPSDPRGAAGHRRAPRSRDGWRVTASSAPLTCWCRRAGLLFSLLCSI